MKITFIESPEGLLAEGTDWEILKRQIIAESPDLLVTNEMPFGSWLSVSTKFNHLDASNSIAAHDAGLTALKDLNIPLVLSSRPVKFGDKLANEAFSLVNGDYQFAHQKHYFPEEAGFYETQWFCNDKPGFDVIKANGLTIGFLLCTELMFNEWARSYREQGAQLIVIPRATGQSVSQWKTAAAMAAIVSGCYVVSSNRVGKVDKDLTFGGIGFAFAPDGQLLSETSVDHPVISFHLDIQRVAEQQKTYPCYVHEIATNSKSKKGVYLDSHL